MAEINLIPQTAKQDSKQSILTRKISRALIAIFVVFLVVCAAGGSLFFLKSRSISEKQIEYDKLTSEVQSLQQNEGSLVLLRDRLQKIETVLAGRNHYDRLKIFNEMLTQMPGGGEITQVKASTGLYELSIKVTDSQSLGEVIDLVKNVSGFDNITIQDMTYNESTGYSVIFSVL